MLVGYAKTQPKAAVRYLHHPVKFLVKADHNLTDFLVQLKPLWGSGEGTEFGSHPGYEGVPPTKAIPKPPTNPLIPIDTFPTDP